MTGGFLLFSGKGGENMAETENLSWIKIYSEELPTPTEWTVVDNDFDSDELSNEEISEIVSAAVRKYCS